MLSAAVAAAAAAAVFAVLGYGKLPQDWWSSRKGNESFVTEVEAYVNLEFYPQCAPLLGVYLPIT